MLQLALIVIVVFTYEIFFAQRLAAVRRAKIVLGVWFGTAIVLTMMFPIHITQSAHVDLRIVPLLLGTLYGGRRMGIALAALIVLYRLLLGFDSGIYTTAITLLVSMPGGLYFQRLFAAAEKWRKVRIAIRLSLFYGVTGSVTSLALRGVTAEVLRAHIVYLVTIIVNAAFSVALSETVLGMIERNRRLQARAKDAEIAFSGRRSARIFCIMR
ncbi:LytS/YhcK type 5TM receptor domain-containing protein [Cohnella sp. GCM10012308]|uniref:LytS/YhcK type 5TM receptor domain-containing protein n=1 Tax=Cohnella sp. GCM10012308 TaxID=3317329 RepID=UPI0036182846